VRAAGVGIDDLDADMRAGLHHDGRVHQAGDAEGLIGTSGRAGNDGEPDAHAGEGDPVPGR
jgi:hypothetical protein